MMEPAKEVETCSTLSWLSSMSSSSSAFLDEQKAPHKPEKKAEMDP